MNISSRCSRMCIVRTGCWRERERERDLWPLLNDIHLSSNRSVFPSNHPSHIWYPSIINRPTYIILPYKRTYLCFIYIYIYLQPSIYDLHSSSTAPSHGPVSPLLLWRHWAERPGQTHQKRFPMKVARKLTYGTGERDHSKRKFFQISYSNQKFFGGFESYFSGV